MSLTPNVPIEGRDFSPSLFSVKHWKRPVSNELLFSLSEPWHFQPPSFGHKRLNFKNIFNSSSGTFEGSVCGQRGWGNFSAQSFYSPFKTEIPSPSFIKGFLISGYPWKLYLERRNNWMKCINSGLIFQAFIKVGGFMFIVRILWALQQERPKFVQSFGQGGRCGAWQFSCLSCGSG